MLKLRVVHAHEGDCLILLYGTPTKPRALLCDGGPKDTYEPFLRRTLEKLEVSSLDAVLLSHVDTDHVLGLLDFFAALRDAKAAGEKPFIGVSDLWINSFDKVLDKTGKIRRRLNDVSAALSAMSMTSTEALQGVKDGNSLSASALVLGIPTNQALEGESFLADGQAPFDFHNLQIQVVGPTQANLDALLETWEEWLEKQEQRIADGKLHLAAMSDRSIPNLSSVQLLVKAHGKSLLLTGDGRGDHLLQALEAAELLEEDGTFQVDVLKVPHHGSDRNVNRAFFERVRAKTYVISADGKHGNPDLPTLQWIVEANAEADEPITIVCTNQTPTIDKLLAAFPPAESNYELVLRKENKDFIEVDIA